MNKIALLLGVAFCGLSVVLGAFGAHGLKDKLSDYSISVFNKGVMYQFFHGIGIILTVVLNYNLKSLSFDTSIWLFIFGIILTIIFTILLRNEQVHAPITYLMPLLIHHKIMLMIYINHLVYKQVNS